MNPVNLPARVIVPAVERTQTASSGQGQAFASALSEVGNIARDMAQDRMALATQIRRIVKSGDTRLMPQVYTRIQDANARNEVFTTVLTKVTSGIDQIVKMQ